MQGMNPGQQNQGSKQGGLSWSTPSSSQGSQNTNAQTSPLLGGAKPVAPVVSKPASLPSNTRARATENNNSMRSVWIFIAGLVVGMILIWSWDAVMTSNTPVENGTQNPANTTGSTGNTTTIGGTGAQTTAPGTVLSEDVVVLGQDAGNAVVVKDASVAGPTWLVVYELFNGKPIRALGATMFFPEYNGKGGVISLLRATQPNTTYFVGQSMDSGNHTFTPHVNKEVLDSSGRMVGTTFKTN
jgi:hypothetical protein